MLTGILWEMVDICNMKPCSRRLLISCDLNQNELVQTRISEACFGDLTQCANDWHVIFMLFFCMLCWESVYIFFLQTTVHLPRNNKNTWIICHVHYKGPMALINFKTSLVIFFFSCALTLYSYHFVDLKNVYFCWNNVTPALVIITVLSSCSCINIRLIFVCNTL